MASEHILGLDLGTASIGWCLVNPQSTENPIADMGVRIFPEGVDRSQGEKSRNQDRRLARSLRRQTYRRARRKRKLMLALQDADLLPREHTELNRILKDGTSYPAYQLRRRALDEELTQHQLGRALYHLGQRRGYLSNRKTGSEKDGAVSSGIESIQEGCISEDARTLGEYFAILENQQQAVRGFYTSRQMYIEEFNAIWQQQQNFKPKLSGHKKRIFNAIFEQRKLKLQKHLIGKCGFEPNRKRAYAATLVAQEFRLWQNLNNFKVLFSDGTERFLNEKERLKLHGALDTAKSKNWGAIKRLLGFYESDRFNLEKVRQSGLLGNQTAAIVSSAIGKALWRAMPHQQQEQLVFDLLNIDQEEALIRRLTCGWNLDLKAAATLVDKSLSLPKGVMHLSHKALRNIVEHMRAKTSPEARGIGYDEACRLAGYHHSDQSNTEKLNRLPLFNRDLRNPMVERTLHQVRRIVNAIIQQYGKPGTIRLEMARDLKNSARERANIKRRQSLNEKANQQASRFLQGEVGLASPSRNDMLKFRLWLECDRQCVFTGKSINCCQLFGSSPVFEVEHILPYLRTLDDSFMNKTLCYVNANRDKGNRTPKEAFSGTQYDEILQRAKKLPQAKFRRFGLDLDQLETDFVSQQLNETRYIAREVKDYLSCLNCKIEPIKGGQITAILRRSWGLNNILSDTGEKTRLDHRHHAIDALVVALTSRHVVQQFSRYHSFGQHGQLRMENLPCPIEQVRHRTENAINQIIVSHKINHKVNGALHKEFLYGLTGEQDKRNVPEVVIRKPIHSLKNEKHLKEIRDEVIRNMAIDRLSEAGGDTKKAFQDPENPFGFTTKKGEFVPIKSVRCTAHRSVTKVAHGRRARNVWTMGNHHIEIIETKDKKGQPKWQARAVVSTLEAMRKQAQGIAIVDRSSNDSERFIFALHANDMLELNYKGERIVCRVQKMDINGNVVFRPHADATIDHKTQIKFTVGSFRNSAPKLLLVNCLGKVRNT